MLILMLLTSAFTVVLMLFIMLCVGIIVVAQHGYPDESVKPAPGKWWPRLTLRAIWVILRAKGPDSYNRGR
jgi:hypothetical protein